VDPPQLDQLVVGVRDQPHAIVLRGVREQDFSGQPGFLDTGFIEEPLTL
jgi:hypothetical protein